MEESTPEEKQQYLREKILDINGIEANNFVDFLKEKKGEEGADISNWTMKDLKEVVKEFYEINNIPMQSSEENKYNIENEKIETNENKNEEKINNNNNDIKKEIKNDPQNNNNSNNNDVSDKINNILKDKINNMIDNINNENVKKSEINEVNKKMENENNINKNKKEEKEESIKFIIDEDSLMDFMLTAKGIKKTNKEEDNKKPNNELPKKNNIEPKINTNNNNKNDNTINNKSDINNINGNINTNNKSTSNLASNQQFNFENIFKNNNLEKKEEFNFEQNFKNNNSNNLEKNQQQFNFEAIFNNNNIEENQQKFNFEQNFKNIKNNNIEKKEEFNFEQNFKNSNNNLEKKEEFNFEQNFKNNNKNDLDKKQEFNFDQNFKNNNNIEKKEEFKFDQNFKNNNIDMNKQQFNFEENFKKKEENNLKFDFDKNFNFNNNNTNNLSSNNKQTKSENNSCLDNSIQKPNLEQNINNKNHDYTIEKDNKNDNGKNNNQKDIENKIENIENDNNNNNNVLNNENNSNINNDENNGDNNINKNNKNNIGIDITKSNLSNIIDKNDHDSEYGIIMQDYIKTKKIEETEFSSHKDIIIKITDPIKVEQSFFLGKSVNYLVTTAPFKYAVRRRYSDFIWLRDTLVNLFSTNLIPKITKKGKVTTDKHDDAFIQKRMKNLEKFINFLIKDELIKSSQVLYDFLTIQKDEEFQNVKKVYEKIKISPLDDIKERKSLDGELKIKITKEKEIYLENIKDNCIYNENIFKKLNNNFKALQDEFSAVIKRFEAISDVFRELYGVSKNYLDQNTITESYAQMDIMFKKLSESFDSIKTLINSEIREYFKFTMNNFTALSEMTPNIDLAKNNYLKLAKSLINKKNDLFKKGDISKWELNSSDKNRTKELIKDKVLACNKMLPKETNICINAKEIYGFYLNKLINEFERMRQVNSVLYKKKVCYFCQEQIVICSNYTRILGDIIMTIDSCTNKKH